MTTQHMELENLTTVDLDAGLVFSGKPSGTTIKGYSAPCAYVPHVDQDYSFGETARDIILWLLGDAAQPLFIYGPSGSGKTSCVKQLAARINMPVFELTGHARLEFSDLAGHLTVQDGNMTFQPGPLTLAMKHGAIFLLNEVDLCEPSVLAGLNSILDRSPLCLSENGGELVQPHPLFRIVCTANSNGGGDSTGLYSGVQRQNLAFMDRFTVVEMDYPAPDVENRLLARLYPAIPKPIRSRMVKLANEVRKSFMGADDTSASAFEVTLSTRTLLRWASLTVAYQPLATQGISPIRHALDRALGFRASRETRAALHELCARHFPGSEPAPDTASVATAADNTSAELSGDDAVSFVQLGLAKSPVSIRPTIHLRKTTQTAVGSKDWLATAKPNGLEISYGKTGSVNQSKQITLDACHRRNVKAELENRALGKIREGYRVVKAGCNLIS